MKLAEALVRRADAQKRYEQLRARAIDNARYQEGEEPTEDPTELVEQAEGALADLERLIGRRNAYGRQLRSELRYVAGVQVDDLRRRADDTARQLRELDLLIQQRNWEVDLLD